MKIKCSTTSCKYKQVYFLLFVMQNFNCRDVIRWISYLFEATEHLLKVCSCFDNKDVHENFFAILNLARNIRLAESRETR